jgi:hypothetical protein
MKSQSDYALSADAVAADIGMLMRTQVQCVLATLSPTAPSQHLMAYAFDADLRTVYVTSMRQTEKVGNMSRRPAVSMLWDNRTGNTKDHVEGTALMATGHATLLNSDHCAQPASALQSRNSSLTDLLNHADSAIMAICISGYRLVRGYSSIIHYEPAVHLVTDQSTRRT